MKENDASGLIVKCSVELHKALGPGLLDSAYEYVLANAWIAEGLHVRQQVPIPLKFRDQFLDKGYRVDLIVNEIVLVEVK